MGFLSYESGPGFEAKLPRRAPGPMPTAWFAIFESAPKFYRELEPCYGPLAALDLSQEWSREDYANSFDLVKGHIAAGDCYQINLCHRLSANTGDSLASVFSQICGVQPPPFATFLSTDRWEIACFSPELFFERVGDRVIAKPMKGTAARPANPKDIDKASEALRNDPKNRAENLMIVDMLRNDLGRLAKPGTVKTPELFTVENHRTVLQMTSTVEAIVDGSTTALMQAMFPPASITGAPKVAACRIIQELESSARGVYTGAIGTMMPDGSSRFCVAIRTAVRDLKTRRLDYGVGSGIVWDSELESEWQETLLKSAVLKSPAPQWELIECFHKDALLQDEWMMRHINRFKSAAGQVGVPFSEHEFRQLLEPYRHDLASRPPKVRIALRADGALSVAFSESDARGDRLTATLADESIRSKDPNLRIKSNSRAVYDRHLLAHPAFDEVLLYNERGEVTEFCRGAAAFRFGDRWITPPPTDGCLASIGVERLVADVKIAYETVKLEALDQVPEVWLVNAVRGIVPVDLTCPPRAQTA